MKLNRRSALGAIAAFFAAPLAIAKAKPKHRVKWILFDLTEDLNGEMASQRVVVTSICDRHGKRRPRCTEVVHSLRHFVSDAGCHGLAEMGSDGRYHCSQLAVPDRASKVLTKWESVDDRD